MAECPNDSQYYDTCRRLIWLNLRQAIDEIERISGWAWHALRKADLSKKCHCVSDRANAYGGKPDPNCKRCFGTGYYFTDHLVKAFIQREIPGVEFSTPAGLLSTTSKFAILKYDRPVRTVDLLLALDLNPDTGEIVVPPRIRTVYAIQDAEPVYGDHGQIAYWRAYIEERNISNSQLGQIGTDRDKDFPAGSNLDPGV